MRNFRSSYSSAVLRLGLLVATTTFTGASIIKEQSAWDNEVSQTGLTSTNEVVISSNCFIPRDATYIAVARSDNGSTGPIPLPFTYSLYGTLYNQVWINTNGNLTFAAPFAGISMSNFPTNPPMVAPFWADVDTRTGGQIYYKLTSTSLIVTWDSVGYFNNHADKTNTFQVVLTNGTDPLLATGLNTAFYYKDMQWTTGDASGGTAGFGGLAATVGVNRSNPGFAVQIGRFSFNSAAYDGPFGSNDGINYLDNKCFLFDGTRTCNLETCNGVDDDCDGLVDEGCNTFYRDVDQDTYGVSNNFVYIMSAVPPAGYVARSGDCNEWDPAINPGATETCNFKDDDCDGVVDEGCRVFYRDFDGDTYGLWHVQIRATSLPAGYAERGGDCKDSIAAINPGATEMCNTIDDNCNGLIDEGCRIFFRDADGDGWGNSNQPIIAPSRPPGYVVFQGDCNDANPAIHPGQAEQCNGVDDNCNGIIDENCAIYFRDADSDGWGDFNQPKLASSRPPGYVLVYGDCNDFDPSINPSAVEICNFKDDDCDNVVDEGCKNYYRDKDGDTYGSAPIRAMSLPFGYVERNGDCDDDDPAINPGATEICNDIDDNCNFLIDEGCLTLYRDADGDFWGDEDQMIRSTILLDGYVFTPGDCDDNDASVHPDAIEKCNDKDDDCNGQVDEGCQTYYRDADGDRYGDPAQTRRETFQPFGYILTAEDCDDNDDSVNPAATEHCNGKDDNCDGQVDEGCLTFYQDADGDGFGGSNTIMDISPPPGYVDNSEDCNDWDAAINPSATEICNFRDDNCDGQTDEECKVFYRDSDGDGYGLWHVQMRAMEETSGWVLVGGDCDDGNSNVHPGASEVCNGINDDCNGLTDEGCDGSRINLKAIVINEDAGPSGFNVKAYPNPSRHVFNIQLQGDVAKGKITVRIFDYLGRLVEIKDNVTVGQVIKIGEGYKNGMYILEAVQGKSKRMIKIIKS